jgi:hypothetical protein
VSSERGYRTPEEAALAGFPSGLARVVRLRTDPAEWACQVDHPADEVEVELMTNEPPSEHGYFVHVECRARRWFEGIGHN